MLIDGSRTVGGFAATAPQPGSEQVDEGGGTLEQIPDRTVGPHADDDVHNRVVRTKSSSPQRVVRAAVAALEAWDRDLSTQVGGAVDLYCHDEDEIIYVLSGDKQVGDR